MLEARAIHTGRSAYHHLLAMAQTHGIAPARVDEVIELVGLERVARKRVGGFSLGMGQRLGIAAALLGDPQTLILDEPANGLDPEGILWIRNLLKRLAAEGRTVFLSSHLMSEMALTADHLIVIGRGRLIADATVDEVVAQASADAAVLVRTPRRRARCASARRRRASRSRAVEPGVLEVHGLTSARRSASSRRASGIVLDELTPRRPRSRTRSWRLTGDAVEYHAATPRDAEAEVAA